MTDKPTFDARLKAARRRADALGLELRRRRTSFGAPFELSPQPTTQARARWRGRLWGRLRYLDQVEAFLDGLEADPAPQGGDPLDDPTSPPAA